MNREAEIRRMRAGSFMLNNGRVLLTVNLLREKYNSLKSVEQGVKYDGIERQDFIDSVNFLAESGYIRLREIGTHISADLADFNYTRLEAKVTEKGIRLLAGGLSDDMVGLG